MSRYIDADKIEYIDFKFGIFRPISKLKNIAFKDDIDKIPTADVAPIIYASWFRPDCNPQDKEIFLECSHCYKGTICRRGHLYNFCPNCGAKMNKDEKVCDDEENKQ